MFMRQQQQQQQKKKELDLWNVRFWTTSTWFERKKKRELNTKTHNTTANTRHDNIAMWSDYKLCSCIYTCITHIKGLRRMNAVEPFKWNAVRISQTAVLITMAEIAANSHKLKITRADNVFECTFAWRLQTKIIKIK